MNAAAIVDRLKSNNIALRVDEGIIPLKLQASPNRLLTETMRSTIVAYREDLLLELLWPAIPHQDMVHVRGILEEGVVREKKATRDLWSMGGTDA
jgi:hypothetical protein